MVVMQEYRKESKVVSRSLPVRLNINRSKVGYKKKIKNKQERECKKGEEIEREEEKRGEERRIKESCGYYNDV